MKNIDIFLKEALQKNNHHTIFMNATHLEGRKVFSRGGKKILVNAFISTIDSIFIRKTLARDIVTIKKKPCLDQSETQDVFRMS
jgi:hypothetical protein